MSMKIALVHELLTMRGGAERVLRILAAMFPDAPIYTLLYDESKLGKWFPASRVRTSKLQKFTKFSTNHRLYLPFFPRAVEEWNFSEFDVVLSTSSAFVHGIITNSSPKHLAYINSPARYLWDRTHDVLREAGHGPLGPLKKFYLKRQFHKLRIWDSEAADRADKVIAASREVQRRMQLYWRRESEVIYPPIDDFWLQEEIFPPPQTLWDRNIPAPQNLRSPDKYYLVVSTLARYKRIDLAIQACNELKRNLVIVGEGADEKRLKNIAGPTITFTGYLPQADIYQCYANARATIFPGEEDFGLVPVESMSCGTPVIAFGKGGALETILEGKTGVFFNEPTAQALQSAMETFEKQTFSAEECREQARKFSRREFEEKIRQVITRM